MRQSWAARCKALLLVALLVSGGGGLPVLDVALFHLSAVASADAGDTGDHVVSGPDAASHRTHCTLGTGLACTTLPTATAVQQPVASITFAEATALPAAFRPIRRLSALAAPRAPPTLIA